jgi:hypothetical protein
MRFVFLMILVGCGSESMEEPQGVDPVAEPVESSPAVKNTIGGNEIPTEPGRTNDTVGEPREAAAGMAGESSGDRPAIVSVPVEGELPGVRGKAVARTPQEMIDAFSAKGGQPQDAVTERRVAQMFMDEEFDEDKFQKMKNMKNVDVTPDPHKYDDPRNYAQNQARKKKGR